MTRPRGPHPFPDRHPSDPAAAALATEIAVVLAGWADRARAAGLRDLAYLLSMAEAEAVHEAGRRHVETRLPPRSH